MTTEPSYIGVVLELKRVLSDGRMWVKPKPGRIESVQRSIVDYELSDYLAASEACTFMGRVGFLGTHCAGNLLRGCVEPISKRANDRSITKLTGALRGALKFAATLLANFPEKLLDLLRTWHRTKHVLLSSAPC